MHILSLLSIIVFGISTMRNYNNLKDLEKGLFRSCIYIISLSISWWALTSSQFYIAETKESAWFWYKLSSIAWISIIPATSVYFIYLSGYKKLLSNNISKIVFAFLPSLLLIQTLFGNSTPMAIDLVQSRGGFGWTYINTINSIWLWLYILMDILYIGLPFCMLKNRKNKESLKYKKELYTWFIIIDTFLICLGIFTDIFLPIFTDYFAPIANITMVVFNFVYFYLSNSYDTLHLERYISSDVVFNTSAAAFVVLDEKGRIFFCNDKACEILKTTKEKLLNQEYTFIRDENYHDLKEDMNNKNSKDFYDRVLHVEVDGIECSLMVSMACAYGKNNKFLGYVVSFQDVTKIIDVNRLLEKLSTTDEVTKLPNRRCFLETTKKYIKAYEEDNINFGMVYIDLNNFKHINDNYGHEIGDLVLIRIGDLFKNLLEENELLFKIGGDDFVILINSPNIIDRVNSIEYQLENTIKTSFMIENIKVNIGLSYGSNLYSESNNLADFIKKAYEEMIVYKESRK